MKEIPYAIIRAAKECNSDAINYIKHHFEGYIASRCLVTYEDEDGHTYTYVDDDLRYQAEASLFASIFSFRFKEAPDDFTL
jgi:hypothetical protein